MDTQACRSTITDYALVKNNATTDAGSISAIDGERSTNSTNFVRPYSLPGRADDSAAISSDAKTFWMRQVIHDGMRNHANNDNVNDEAASVRVLSNVDHEDATAIEEGGSYDTRDVQDYKKNYHEVLYNHYGPSTAKDLDIVKMRLFAQRSESYEECVRPQRSLIYDREPLLAVEVVPYHQDGLSLKYLREGSNDILYSQCNQSQERMLVVHSYVKTNAGNILYSQSSSRDTFDLNTVLEPSTRLINGAPNVQASANVSNNDDSLDLMTRIPISQSNNEEDVEKHRRNRSSLSLMEPLLLMPELANSGHIRTTKRCTVRSERVLIIRIILAYVFTFLSLASITFYFVYFF